MLRTCMPHAKASYSFVTFTVEPERIAGLNFYARRAIISAVMESEIVS